VIIDGEDYLAHYGILRRSGRYPWGSGGPENGGSDNFLGYVEQLRGQGLSEVDIAKGFGVTTTQLRAAKSIAKNEVRQAQVLQAQRLKDKGYSNVAIGKRMGNLNESTVRSLLAQGERDVQNVLHSTADMLRQQVEEKGYLDVGRDAVTHLGIAQTKLATAVAMLKEEGYNKFYVKVRQLGTGHETTIQVLAKPGVTYSEVYQNRDKIKTIGDYTNDGGRLWQSIQTPLSVNSKRVAIAYKEDGGDKADGVIYVRPGAPGLSMGNNRYAQVRIAVDGTHYLKGMAMLKDDLPPGVDLQFNTNKTSTGNKLDAMKPMKNDPDDPNPFGATVRQITDSKGRVTSAMNIVNDEGKWDTWSNNLSSQFLSKQSPQLAKQQLDLAFRDRKDELDEIMNLTNPVVRKKLLEDFADKADASATHLKAAALPRQANRVILPINSLKETEVYAPGFRNGEKVVLVRYPHGGTFELPELTVNNRHPQAKKALGDGGDAVGINHKVAQRLSGADFDGDSVIVIPNSSGRVKTSQPLAGLKDFDPQHSYPQYEGMKVMTPRQKGIEMGDISNLITDMTIKKASSDELARAVRHSMVVIDAEKHKLDWKSSARDNGIAQLKTKYQGGPRAGAATLISRKKQEIRVPERKGRPAAEGGPIDRVTGRRMYVPTGASFVGRKGETVVKTEKAKRILEVDDVHKLSSGTPVERIYADYANNLKDLGNTARKAAVSTKTTPMSPSAKAAYSNEVTSLTAKLRTAQENSPRERQAQLIANSIYAAKRAARPDMDADQEKKARSQALIEARTRVGAKKQVVEITDTEWKAIQSGAISNAMLERILNNSNIEVVKKLATPRVNTVMTANKQARAAAMLASGYTQQEVADALGVALSTLKSSISREE
jgi:transcriptional regulator